MLLRPRQRSKERFGIGRSACPGPHDADGMRHRHIDNGPHDLCFMAIALIGVFLLKLDGYRAVAFKTNGKVHFCSRNGKDFSAKYPAMARALASMPDETVIDGEIVALEAGRPSFNALQNHGAATGQLFFYVFDIMIAAGEDVMAQPLEAWREILRSRVLSHLADPIRESPVLEATLPDLIHSGSRIGRYSSRSCCSLSFSSTPITIRSG